MIDIKRIDGNKIYYECSCGVRGKCIIKPLSPEDNHLAVITCPSCFNTSNVSLDCDEERNEDTFYSLAIVTENEIIKQEE